MSDESTLYRVRLDAPDGSGNYRDVTVQASSEEEAQAVCEAKEQRIVDQAAAENPDAEPVAPFAVSSVAEEA